jgi:glycosyltransferase involved in cell wall biosynthesis
MKVMQIVSGGGINGAIRHCLLLTRELTRRGNELTVVCQPGAWIADQLRSDPVDIVPSDLHRWPPDELRRIAGIVRRKRIDVVHTHMSRAHFFGVLLRWFGGVPCVASAQSRHLQLHWMFNDLVIAASEATRRFHQTYNLVRADRIVTIHNFVEVAEGDLSAGQRRQIREEFGASESSLLIGIVGDVIPRKGLLYLVRALPAILAASPQARLVVIGRTTDADYESSVRAAADQLVVSGSIVWTGFRGDVSRLLRALDVFVLASLEETLPLAVLEAMAAGLPVVSTSVGGIPECVLPGQTGFLVPPGDSSALAEAVAAVLRDPALRQRMGEAGRRRVRARFSGESQVARIEAAFARVARAA